MYRVIILALLMVGCGLSKPTADETLKQIAVTEHTTKAIQEHNHNIITSADRLIAYNIPKVTKEADYIKAEAEQVGEINNANRERLGTIEEGTRELRRERDELVSGGGFRKYLPYILLILGLAIAGLSVKLGSVVNTGLGAVMAFSSIVVHAYYEKIAQFGMVILAGFIIYLIAMVIIQYQKRTNKIGKNNNLKLH